jgi:hypothetical protein
MASHHDWGIDCETWCGGTPDDEAADVCGLDDVDRAPWTADDQAAYEAYLNAEAATQRAVEAEMHAQDEECEARRQAAVLSEAGETLPPF